jgi:hypothetical protein
MEGVGNVQKSERYPVEPLDATRTKGMGRIDTDSASATSCLGITGDVCVGMTRRSERGLGDGSGDSWVCVCSSDWRYAEKDLLEVGINGYVCVAVVHKGAVDDSGIGPASDGDNRVCTCSNDVHW